MKQEIDTIYFIKAVCEKKNRKRVTKLFLGAIALNIAVFLGMYGFFHLVVLINNAF